MSLISINSQHNPDVTVQLSRYDDITKKITTATLINDYIIEIKLINDVHYPCPLLKIHYKDYSNNLINYPPDGYSGISFTINELMNNDSNINILIDHDFNITNYEIVKHEQQYTEYVINACSNNHVKLISNVNYSTGSDNNSSYKDVIDIISDIYDKIKIDNEKLVPRNLFDPSNKKIFYIAPPNNTCWDVITDLLTYASYGLNGYYTTFYNLYNKSTVILNMSKYLSNIDKQYILPNNTYTIIDYVNYSAADLANSTYVVVSDIESLNYNTVDANSNEHNYNLSPDMYFNNFNYLKREWNTDYFNYNNIVNNYIMKNGNNYSSNLKPTLKDNKATYLKFSQEFNTLEYPNLYDNLDRINKFSDVVQFKCRGFLNREVGQICTLTSGNKNMGSRFNGIYMIGRIEHSWKIKNDYINTISLIRNTQYKSTNN